MDKLYLFTFMIYLLEIILNIEGASIKNIEEEIQLYQQKNTEIQTAVPRSNRQGRIFGKFNPYSHIKHFSYIRFGRWGGMTLSTLTANFFPFVLNYIKKAVFMMLSLNLKGSFNEPNYQKRHLH